MDASCRHVSGKDNAAILYRDYRILCGIERIKRNYLFEQYRNQIELDITRTYPRSRWLQQDSTKQLIRHQLRVWCIYSTVGYFQGLLFLLVPLPLLEAWTTAFAFVRMVKNLHFVQWCDNALRKTRWERRGLHVLRVLSHCIDMEEDQMQLRQMLWVIEFNIMFTLALNRCMIT